MKEEIRFMFALLGFVTSISVITGLALMSDKSFKLRQQLFEKFDEAYKPDADTSEFETAELIAYVIKQSMTYDYNCKSAWQHNLKNKIQFGLPTYENFLTNKPGICTDYCEIYAAVLQHYGLNANYVDRIKTSTGAEHAYVDIIIDQITYRVDITSYCTAYKHEASTDFFDYWRVI